jgi:hypothetical protein
MRPRSPWLVIAAASLLGGCFGDAGPTVVDVGEHAVSVRSESGQVTAEINSDGPLSEGSNDFLVRISPASGASIGGVEITAVSAIMPAHAHAADPPEVKGDGDAYRIHDLRLSMPGHWEITLKLLEEGAPDTLRFAVEVP